MKLVATMCFLFVAVSIALAQTSAGIVQTGTGASASASPAQKKSQSQPGATDGLKSKLPAENQDDPGTFRTQKMGRKAGSGKGLEGAIQNAVKSDEFTLQSGKEYKLGTTVNWPDDTRKDRIAIDYQVGSIDKKPAFVTVMVESKDAPKMAEDAEKLFGGKLSGPVHAEGLQTTMSACTGSRVCVETEKVGDRDVCVRWKCISKQVM